MSDSAFSLPRYAPCCALGYDRMGSATEARLREPRPPEKWLTYGRARRNAPPIGGQCVVIAKSGEMFVGTLIADEPRILVRLAGSRKILVASRVQALYPTPVHSFEERRLVVDRQKRGEPAAIINGATKTDG